MDARLTTSVPKRCPDANEPGKDSELAQTVRAGNEPACDVANVEPEDRNGQSNDQLYRKHEEAKRLTIRDPGENAPSQPFQAAHVQRESGVEHGSVRIAPEQTDQRGDQQERLEQEPFGVQPPGEPSRVRPIGCSISDDGDSPAKVNRWLQMRHIVKLRWCVIACSASTASRGASTRRLRVAAARVRTVGATSCVAARTV